MRVKKLTLQGFKSFARRTEFEFRPGVTVVVGPNGSGKSNVADALRWVIGEQSNRLLRTRRQDDVVFNGSDKKPAMGMAEATLTLDNEDRWLPLDFAEVEIGRRVYRDGASDYLLNGSQARLRDIQDVLSRAEVGQNSYAVIGQGLVDQVLRMSPFERRSLIDEAADIHVVRGQIRSAQEQLTETRGNLDQLGLVVREIEPRLRALERQRERAARHIELSRQLRAVQHRAFIVRWQDLDLRLANATEAAAWASTAAEASRANVRDLESQLDAVMPAITDGRQSLAALEAQHRAQVGKRREQEQQAARRREQIGLLDRELIDLDDEIERLEQELVDLGHQPGPEGEAPIDRSDLDTLRIAVSQQEAEQRRIDNAFEHEISRLRALEHRVRDIERAGGEADAVLQSDAIEKLTLRLTNMGARREEMLQQLRHHGGQVSALTRRQRELERSLAAYRSEADETRGRLAKLDDEMRRTEESLRGDVRDLDAAQARLDALRGVLAEYQGVTMGTRAVLQAAGIVEGGDVQLEGVIDVLARQIRVPAHLEHAINAALDHRLHAILVESMEYVDEAIAWLAQSGAGRAQFIALDGLQESYPVSMIPDGNIIGVASTFIQCEERLRPAIHTLLGRVLICPDVPSAQIALDRGFGSVVTVDGIYFERNGIISGGAARSDDTVFTRQRELDELPVEIGQMEERVERDRQQLEQARLAVDEMRGRGSSIEASYAQARKELDAVTAELARQRNGFARSRQSIRDSRRERVAAQSRLDTAVTAHQEAEAAVQRLARDHAPLVAECAQIEEKIAGLREQRAAAMQAVTDARATYEEAARHRALVEQVERQRAEAIARAEQQLASRSKRRDDREAERATHRDALTALEAQVAEANADTTPEAMSAEIRSMREDLEQLEKEERQVQRLLREGNVALVKAEREQVEAGAHVERLKGEYTALLTEIDTEGFVITDDGELSFADGGGAPEPDPALERLTVEALNAQISRTRSAIRKLGPINSDAPEDYEALSERYSFLAAQIEDLRATDERLTGTIGQLQDELRDRFAKAFGEVNTVFQEKFKTLFGSGEARIELTDPDDLANTGIELFAVPPGKRIGNLTMLSGGERSLTALSFLFALLAVNPAPFCVLDEVDAALDESNVNRLADLLKESIGKTQFVVISHNRKTIEIADAIYGVSMGRDGVSTVLSMQLEDVETREPSTAGGTR